MVNSYTHVLQSNFAFLSSYQRNFFRMGQPCKVDAGGNTACDMKPKVGVAAEHLEGKSGADHLELAVGQGLDQRGAVFVAEQVVEDPRVGRVRELEQEEVHRWLRELEGKLPHWVSEGAAQLTVECVCTYVHV